jgi:hypothetical protein
MRKVLGLEAVEEGMKTLATAAPPGRRWRRAQALAQMQAAGFPLPQLPFGLSRLVAVWAAGIAIWDNRWPLLVESLAAGLGAGFGLGLFLLFTALFVWRDPQYVPLSIYLQPLGFIVGSLAVAMTWLILLSLQARTKVAQAVGRVMGVWLGFGLGVAALWLPLMAQEKVTSGLSWTWQQSSFLLQYLLGGSFWGLGVALGREMLARFQARTTTWRALLGGGLGGAMGCLLAVWLGIGVPFVEPTEILFVQTLRAVMVGFGLSAGLTGGWELGARLWRRLQNQ